MVELTVDGNKVEVPEGSMVMHAAQKIGLYVPHFCYHKKLSIAANCRMCLVEVEKAPKALPACATPVTNGMVVHTCSEKAKAAQKSVMEFLLINHPLDCPICDQGGECQLQDLAVGYGGSSSRYHEEKRVVFHKDLGPLVSAEEMSRCIHCTRCVRFGQEIGGMMELGMLNRGEHAEITSFVGRSIESELSGNMIDICPVGALTSKPFRYSARTWELARRRSVSPHDSVGANLVVQVKGDRVLRVVPFENENVNECWISDRDRFSYEGLNVDDRLAAPMIRGTDGNWQEASWADALQAVAQGLSRVRESAGAGQIGALATEYATTEEFSLLARLTRALGSENIDFRLRQTDAGFDAALSGAPWLGMPIAELDNLDRVLVVGSFLRKDHPLMAQRLRQAVKRGTQVLLLDSACDDPLLPVAARLTVAPSELARGLAEVAVALAQVKELPVPAEFAMVTPGEDAKRIAASLASGSNAAVLMGNLVVSAPNASTLAANARVIAELTGAKFGFLTAGGNTVGGYLAGAVPGRGGKTAAQMLAEPLKAYVVLHAEPTLDADNGPQALAALRGAQFAVALTSYRSSAEAWADVMLPVAPFTETSGTFVNAAGVAQSFKGTVAPHGQSRPAWKVLRVLGNVLHLTGFDDETSEAVRDAALAGGIEGRLSNEINAALGVGQPAGALERLADVPIYRSDAIVRRSQPLQAHAASRAPKARMNARTLAALGLDAGAKVRVSSSQGSVELEAALDQAVADNAVRVSAAFAQTAALGGAFGQISVERA
ncbi:NADH-quinone oxidoreductase subunit NuoG [Bordetella holmesii]|uniref:NADH-quinone oxidoreductase n=2 Tax=Bordetella holmesii TaxID=35814 RepID=A0A158M237_9BORD|nr:NADH-quinone oxidoreductase subunit NuoG [Bordetella holmesii]AHV91059.1 NADH dehydrogenase (quinone), G subunit [Bordetella holmesii ATCC 51541]AIT26866.1 NADH dehydrogenase (quinone), G subunit [Bordetella holmesii 44057]EWM42360.1 NADH dehydrogenase (quinone), G subunit [Bordetella holmesii 41130]EWM47451.1 NADH dehydrogenase (quinone), G subunit [Bordetella holmesii 35009]EWM51613.1 NADH dehydrogenase (quinone), G subunit [Bordetella holmesii 70147]